MKKLRFILPVIAVLLLIGAGLYAMHANRSQAKAYDVEYWDYNGPVGGEADSSNYSLGTSSPTHLSCNLDDKTICQIMAEPDPNNSNAPNLNGENPLDHKIEFTVSMRGNN